MGFIYFYFIFCILLGLQHVMMQNIRISVVGVKILYWQW